MDHCARGSLGYLPALMVDASQHDKEVQLIESLCWCAKQPVRFWPRQL